MKFLYICLTVAFTVYGQLIVKWQVAKAGRFPADMLEKIYFFLNLLSNPWILSCFAGAFLAALCWMVAMTKFDLSYAYPFVSLSFVLVLVFSYVFFHEPVTVPKALGVAFIVIGILIGAQG